MTNLQQSRLSVKSISKNKASLFLGLALAFLLPILSLTSDARAALRTESQNRQNRSIATLCNRTAMEIVLWKKIMPANISSLPTPRIYRVAFQGGGGSEYRCPPGASCPQQILSCPSGWEARSTSVCCAQCCQGSNCGPSDCCRSEGGKGPGDILP